MAWHEYIKDIDLNDDKPEQIHHHLNYISHIKGFSLDDEFWNDGDEKIKEPFSLMFYGQPVKTYGGEDDTASFEFRFLKPFNSIYDVSLDYLQNYVKKCIAFGVEALNESLSEYKNNIFSRDIVSDFYVNLPFTTIDDWYGIITHPDTYTGNPGVQFKCDHTSCVIYIDLITEEMTIYPTVVKDTNRLPDVKEFITKANLYFLNNGIKKTTKSYLDKKLFQALNDVVDDIQNMSPDELKQKINEHKDNCFTELFEFEKYLKGE